MGKEYTAKSFKSGNSVAIRIPAALGVEPDSEWMITMGSAKLIAEMATSPGACPSIRETTGDVRCTIA